MRTGWTGFRWEMREQTVWKLERRDEARVGEGMVSDAFAIGGTQKKFFVVDLKFLRVEGGIDWISGLVVIFDVNAPTK
jgi:hypothetical protein